MNTNIHAYIDHKKSGRVIKRKPFIWRFLGVITLAILPPIGWLAIQYFAFKQPLLSEIESNILLYAYMFAGSLLFFCTFISYQSRNEKTSAEMALHDPLTGLYNIRYLYYRLTEAYTSIDRSRAPLSLMIIDLDYFKKVNDTYGHPAGDEVLKSVANAIAKSRRINEIAARVGGEEFVLLLPNCTMAQAVQVAERVRKTIKEQTVVVQDDIELKITASIGVASTDVYEPGGEKQLYSDADTALYRAKRNGRDLTIAHS